MGVTNQFPRSPGAHRVIRITFSVWASSCSANNEGPARVPELECSALELGVTTTQVLAAWMKKTELTGCLGEGVGACECLTSGACCRVTAPPSARECIAISDKSCRESTVCRHEGRCYARCGVCVALTDEDCCASVDCGRWGACVARSGHCVPIDATCAVSELCRARQWCRSVQPQGHPTWMARCGP